MINDYNLSIKDIYYSILSAMIRFWDNRFHEKVNPLIQLYELELQRERNENSRLLDVIANLASSTSSIIKTAESNEEVKDFEPIQTHQVPWRVRVKQLEKEHRLVKDSTAIGNDLSMPNLMKAVTTEELEKALGVE